MKSGVMVEHAYELRQDLRHECHVGPPGFLLAPCAQGVGPLNTGFWWTHRDVGS